MIIASDDNFLAKMNLGATGTFLRSSGDIPYWDDFQVTTINTTIYVNGDRIWEQRGTNIDGFINADSGTALALSSDGNTLLVGQPGIHSARVYSWVNDAWTEDAVFTEDSGTGTSVAISADGDIAAVGNPTQSKVYLYKKSGGVWSTFGTITGPRSNFLFGKAIDLSDDGLTIIIGEPCTESQINDSGAVYVYTWTSGTAWSIRGNSIPGNTNSLHGYSVAISGDGTVIAMSAILDDTAYFNSGYVKLYTFVTGAWVQRGSTLYGLDVGERFGYALDVSLDGTSLVVGTPYNGPESGQVKVYRWNTTEWIQRGFDMKGASAGEFFGNAVALSDDGNTVIIGALLNSEVFFNGGQVKVFQWTGSTWEQIGNVIDSQAPGDFTGTSVALSSDGLIIAVGAPQHDTRGRVRTFVYTKISMAGGDTYDQSVIIARLDDLDVADVNINNRIDINSTKIALLETGYNTLNDRTLDVPGRLTTAEAGISALVSITTGIPERVTALEESASILDTRTVDLGDRISPLESAVVSLNGDIVGIQSDIQTNRGLIDDLESSIVGLPVRVTDLEDYTVSLDQRTFDLPDRLDTVETDILTLDTRDNQIQGRVTATEASIVILDDRTDELLSRVAVTENDVVSLNDDVLTLGTTLGTLGTLVNTLDTRTTGLPTRVTSLENSATILDQRTADLPGRLTAAEASIVTLDTRTDDLPPRLISVEASVVILDTRTENTIDRVEYLELTDADKASRITSLEQNPLTIAGATLPSSFALGDLLYASGATTLSTIPIGPSGKVLKSTGTGYYWGDDNTGDGSMGTGDLQSVTESGSTTDQTVRFINTGDSIIASGTIQAVIFKGDGGLLSNLPTLPDLQVVTDTGSFTNRTITLSNPGISLIASGKITTGSLSVGGTDMTSATITDNVTRIKNLEVSNALIWSRVGAVSSNVTNLQVSNALAWTNVYALRSNVTNLEVSNTFMSATMLVVKEGISNLQASNSLVWTRVSEIEKGISNLQASNALAWIRTSALNSNVANLQVSNALTWTNIYTLNSNVTNLQVSNTLVWSRIGADTSNVANLQVSNALVWSRIDSVSSNVTNLQVSNALVWSSVGNLQAANVFVSNNLANLMVSNMATWNNVANLMVSNTLAWSNLNTINSNLTNLNVSNALVWSNISNIRTNPLVKTSWDLPILASGDLLYAENESKLTRVGIGAVGTVLTSAGSAPTWQVPVGGGTTTFNNYRENGTNTGISNVQSETTLSVGSNLFIQDSGFDVLYVNGNVYIRKDLVVLDTITASTIRSRRSFVKNTTVIADRPPPIRRVTITQNP